MLSWGFFPLNPNSEQSPPAKLMGSQPWRDFPTEPDENVILADQSSEWVFLELPNFLFQFPQLGVGGTTRQQFVMLTQAGDLSLIENDDPVKIL